MASGVQAGVICRWCRVPVLRLRAVAIATEYAKHSPRMMARRELYVRTGPCGAGWHPASDLVAAHWAAGCQVPRVHDTMQPCTSEPHQQKHTHPGHCNSSGTSRRDQRPAKMHAARSIMSCAPVLACTWARP